MGLILLLLFVVCCLLFSFRDREPDDWLLAVDQGRKPSVVRFRAGALSAATPVTSGRNCCLTFRLGQSDTWLVGALLAAHGFAEVSATSNDFNLLWTGSHPRPHTFSSLRPFQRVNHFPRSYEVFHCSVVDPFVLAKTGLCFSFFFLSHRAQCYLSFRVAWVQFFVLGCWVLSAVPRCLLSFPGVESLFFADSRPSLISRRLFKRAFAGFVGCISFISSFVDDFFVSQQLGLDFEEIMNSRVGIDPRGRRNVLQTELALQ